MTRTLLLDGDITAYQFAAMAEKPTHWGDGLWTLHSDFNEASAQMDDYLANLVEELHGDRLVIALSDSENFRKKVLPSYKENRADTRKPILLKPLRTHMAEHYEVWQRPGLEGDDVLGILSTSDKIIKGERVVVSIDKDLKTIPGLLINLKKAGEAKLEGAIEDIRDGIYEVTEEEADLFHLIQTVAGDATDGYSGCPGIGMLVAERILTGEDNDEGVPCKVVPEEYEVTKGKNAGQIKTRWNKVPCDDSWEIIVSYYAKAGLGEEEAIRQSRVARILRNKDYDFKKKEPILWNP